MKNQQQALRTCEPSLLVFMSSITCIEFGHRIHTYKEIAALEYPHQNQVFMPWKRKSGTSRLVDSGKELATLD
jgi:hypothetical protein